MRAGTPCSTASTTSHAADWSASADARSTPPATASSRHSQPGEVLVSGTVKDLVAGSGIGFDERGTHALKGVPGQWNLYAVTAAA